MLDNREDYHYLTENAIARVTINGNPYGERDEKLVPIGEDEAWLREAANERADMTGVPQNITLRTIGSKTAVALLTLRLEPLADNARKDVDAILAAATWIDPEEVDTLAEDGGGSELLIYETAGEYSTDRDESTGLTPDQQAEEDIAEAVDDFDERHDERENTRNEAIRGVLDEQTGEYEGGADNDFRDALVEAADEREDAYEKAENDRDDALEAEDARYEPVPAQIRARHAAAIAAAEAAYEELDPYCTMQDYQEARENIRKANDDLEADLKAAAAEHAEKVAKIHRDFEAAKAEADTKYLQDRVDAWTEHEDAVFDANNTYETGEKDDVRNTGASIESIMKSVHMSAVAYRSGVISLERLHWLVKKIDFDDRVEKARLIKSLADPWFMVANDDEGGESGCKPRPVVYPLASTPVARIFDDFDRMTVCARSLGIHRMTCVDTVTSSSSHSSFEEVYVYDEHGSWLGGSNSMATKAESDSDFVGSSTSAFSSRKVGIRFGDRWQTESEVVDRIVAYVLVRSGDSGAGYDDIDWEGALKTLNDAITDAVKDAAEAYGLSLPWFYTMSGEPGTYGTGHYDTYGGTGLAQEERYILQWDPNDNAYWQRYEDACDAYREATTVDWHWFRGERLSIVKLEFEREEESDTEYLDAVDAAEDARDAARKQAEESRDSAYKSAQEVHQTALDGAAETLRNARKAADEAYDNAVAAARAACVASATGGADAVNGRIADAMQRLGGAWTAAEAAEARAAAKAEIDTWEAGARESALDTMSAAIAAAKAAREQAYGDAQDAYADAVENADEARADAREAADDAYADAEEAWTETYNKAINGEWDETEGKYVGGANQITPDKVQAAKDAYEDAVEAAGDAYGEAADEAEDTLNSAIESAVRAGAARQEMTVPSGYTHESGTSLSDWERQALQWSWGVDSQGYRDYWAAVNAYNDALDAAGAANRAAINSAKRDYATAMAAISAATPGARMLFTADLPAPGGWQVKSSVAEYDNWSWDGEVKLISTLWAFVCWKPQTQTERSKSGGGGGNVSA